MNNFKNDWHSLAEKASFFQPEGINSNYDGVQISSAPHLSHRDSKEVVLTKPRGERWTIAVIKKMLCNQNQTKVESNQIKTWEKKQSKTPVQLFSSSHSLQLWLTQVRWLG